MTKEEKRKFENTLNRMCTDAIDEIHYCERVHNDHRADGAHARLYSIYHMLKNIKDYWPSLLTTFHRDTLKRIADCLWNRK